jgi:formylglycine-generating enzyme required for sulfatase activity
MFFFLFSGYLFPQNEILIQNISGTEANIPMVYIPSGSFTMGSDKTEMGHFGDEGPKHVVSLDAFWIGRLEITWDLFNLFVSREIDQNQIDKSDDNETNTDVDAVSGATTPYVEMSFGMGIDGYPAICMTQLAAVKFCEWLSAMTGNFYRLPTEAEWEYAARAGSVSAYSFGNEVTQLNEYAWFSENSDEKYHLVGTKKPNAWGLHDMHGNVAEWTLDKYLPTAYMKRKKGVSNPLQESTRIYPKVIRGGSWMDSPKRLRSAARRPSSKKWKRRDPQIPKSKWWHTDAPFVGFRVVRPVKAPSIEEQKRYWNYELIN